MNIAEKFIKDMSNNQRNIETYFNLLVHSKYKNLFKINMNTYFLQYASTHITDGSLDEKEPSINNSINDTMSLILIAYKTYVKEATLTTICHYLVYRDHQKAYREGLKKELDIIHNKRIIPTGKHSIKYCNGNNYPMYHIKKRQVAKNTLAYQTKNNLTQMNTLKSLLKHHLTEQE